MMISLIQNFENKNLVYQYNCDLSSWFQVSGDVKLLRESFPVQLEYQNTYLWNQIWHLLQLLYYHIFLLKQPSHHICKMLQRAPLYANHQQLWLHNQNLAYESKIQALKSKIQFASKWRRLTFDECIGVWLYFINLLPCQLFGLNLSHGAASFQALQHHSSE